VCRIIIVFIGQQFGGKSWYCMCCCKILQRSVVRNGSRYVAVIFKAQANNIIPLFDISRLERCSNRILLRRHPHCWCAIVPLNLLHSWKLQHNIATRSLQRFAVISCNNTYNTNFFHQIVGQ
jgi:hypothetical protein